MPKKQCEKCYWDGSDSFCWATPDKKACKHFKEKSCIKEEINLKTDYTLQDFIDYKNGLYNLGNW